MGLDLRDKDDREECESRLPTWDTKLATTEREHTYWLDHGWADSPDDVEAKQQALEADRSAAEAERLYTDRHMSDTAKAESLAVRVAAEDFVPAHPETPIRRGPGRPRKEVPSVE